MRDAPEIAKLRLFLKLAAQVERVEHLEPLPDLDFNIKCGNLLVGIADERDATERLGDGRLDLGGTLANIAAVAAEVAADYDRFVTRQTEAGTADDAASKARLEARFEAARAECDRLLADLRHENGDFDDWVSSHQPFHWFVEFPSVWQQGGFDVVIGNPPYIKTSKVTGYRWLGYQTQNCPDLYAVCMERAATLLNDQGRFAMIVMHSLCFSRHFVALRACLMRRFGEIKVSSYSRIPDALFGGQVRVRNSIALASMVGNGVLSATTCRRWTAETRDRLFAVTSYADLPRSLREATPDQQWPFLDACLAQVTETLAETNAPLGDATSLEGGFMLGYKNTAQYMLGIFVDEPPTVDLSSGEFVETKSRRTNWFRFDSGTSRDFALTMLAGRWGYLWWLAFSDEFDVTRGTLAAFPGDIERLTSRLGSADNPAAGDMELESLLALSRTLQGEMPKHLAWKANAGVRVGRYNMAKLRHLTDRADWLLARAWGIEDAFEAAGNLRDRMIFGNKE
ncbi:MAG: Eco57I restriction-modification methylase domain-containing protein [Acidimicrobiaceae bacterium]|nr:Eco57I restriction-modification methylase domain-containing protein [Acidimicrobiaceae bacterium]